MNIITDGLPDFVAVKSVKYKVLTDFRIWMEFDRILHQKDISAKDKIMMIMCLCLDLKCGIILPEDAMEMMGALSRFYLCGKEGRNENAVKKERAYDFSEDSGLIYSAFLTQYGIDLLSVPYMHWYVFCSLLEGLESSREFVKVMRYRLSEPEKEQNPEKRKYLKRMKAFYALPDTRTESEKDEQIAQVLFEAFN